MTISLPLSSAASYARFQSSLASYSLTNLTERVNFDLPYYFFQRKDPESYCISIRCLHPLLWLELKTPEELQY